MSEEVMSDERRHHIDYAADRATASELQLQSSESDLQSREMFQALFDPVTAQKHYAKGDSNPGPLPENHAATPEDGMGGCDTDPATPLTAVRIRRGCCCPPTRTLYETSCQESMTVDRSTSALPFAKAPSPGGRT